MSYTCSTSGSDDRDTYTVPYCVLQAVTYDSESSSNHTVQATYNIVDLPPSNTPVISTAIDPHYAGAMSTIQYTYFNETGYTCTESNYSATSGFVSQDAYSASTISAVETSTETRGDKDTNGNPITRKFVYNEPTNALGTTMPKPGS